MDGQQRLDEWLDWLRREAGPTWPGLEAGAETAIAALDAGLPPEVAAVAANARIGLRHPSDAGILAAERHRLATVAGELDRLGPRPRVTATALEELRRIYAERIARLDAVAAAAGAWWAGVVEPAMAAPGVAPAASSSGLAGDAPTVGIAAASPTPIGPGTARDPRSPEPSLGAFLTEHGILLLSYLGAFLLVVATLLFEIYGTSGNDGGPRFAAVLVLNVLFGAAGWWCLARPNLRFVGQSYIWIFTLMTPLTIGAAYVFLLQPSGLSQDLAVAFAGASCAGLYGFLSVRLQSRGHALLALAALPVTVIGGGGLVHAGPWQAALLTLPAIALAALPERDGDGWAALYRPLLPGTLHAYAALAGGWAVLDAGVYSDALATTARHMTAAGAGLTLAYAVLAVRRQAPGLTQAALAVACLTWIGAVYSLDPGRWAAPWATLLALPVALLAGRPSAQRALGLAPAYLEVHLSAIVGLGVLLGLATLVQDGFNGVAPWPLTATLALATAAYALRAWLSAPALAWAAAVGSSLTALAAAGSLDLPRASDRALAFSLVLLSAGLAYLLSSRALARVGLGAFFRVGTAVQALLAVPAILSFNGDGAHALLLLAAAVLLVAVALESAEPLWLYAATPVSALSWYYALAVTFPPPPDAGPDTLILGYSPLPVVYAVLGVVLRRVRFGGWSSPLLVSAGVIGLLVVGGWTSGGSFTFAGRALLAYAFVLYLIAMVEGRPHLSGVALAGAFAGMLELLAGAGAAPTTYPLVFLGAAWVTYAGGLVWDRGGEGSAPWSRVHRDGALALATLNAVSCFVVPTLLDSGQLAALAALWGGCLLFLLDARRHARPVLEYGAAVAASLGALWIARYLGQDNLQTWTLPLGVTLTWAGLQLARDARMAPHLVWARPLVAAGLAVALGATSLQSLDVDATAVPYIAALIAESVASVIAGVSVRSRTMVLGGGAGASVGALRALVLFSHQAPLYLVFGAAALLLLVVSGTLATLRPRLTSLRGDASRAWQGWTL